jgi:YjbE family integral membrane protein
MEMLQSPDFWIGLVKIIWINIILSGDNAVVIALAARSLPPHQQRKAVLWGSGAAVVMRIALTVVAVQLLALPYLQIIGGLLLLWIGVQLLGDEDDGEGEAKEYGTLLAAVRTILIADLVMSLDNVIAVAAAAKGSLTLLVLGLAISIPLVIFGSTLMIKLMERFPIIVVLGAALIGWVGGETMISDTILKDVVTADPWLHYAAAAAGAALVIGIGKALQARSRVNKTVVKAP